LSIYYSELLTSKVVAKEGENSSSNADDGMTRAKQAFPAYGSCSHASGGGTNCRLRFSRGVILIRSGPKNSRRRMRRKSDPAAADKHMRQGSASAFRHVAPALLLC